MTNEQMMWESQMWNFGTVLNEIIFILVWCSPSKTVTMAMGFGTWPFFALRVDLIPPKEMANDSSILQIADLRELYKVFERC